ncbi:MAG: hypothetical protein H7Y43_08870 [Akkermansiaceae bacterium]|nr:hypothetical protein [Verrucomicrobiales bacterium]
MKWRDWLAQWGLDSLKINLQFLEMEWTPQDADRNAAWDLYVELLTRITGQPLAAEHGDEQKALDSIYSLFPLTRDILRKHGPGCGQFAKVGIPVLNQIIRPFTARWHRLSLAGAFNEPARCGEFREELAALQERLQQYTQALAMMANVEDLTRLEKT